MRGAEKQASSWTPHPVCPTSPRWSEMRDPRDRSPSLSPSAPPPCPPRGHREPHGSFPSLVGRDGAVLQPAVKASGVTPGFLCPVTCLRPTPSTAAQCSEVIVPLFPSSHLSCSVTHLRECVWPLQKRYVVEDLSPVVSGVLSSNTLRRIGAHFSTAIDRSVL